MSEFLLLEMYRTISNEILSVLCESSTTTRDSLDSRFPRIITSGVRWKGHSPSSQCYSFFIVYNLQTCVFSCTEANVGGSFRRL